MVHGKEGRDHLILKDQGRVLLDIGTARKEAPINERGEATFKELPSGFLEKRFYISITHPQPYFPVNRKKFYLLEKGKSIYLEVELVGINKVMGRVLDFETEKSLDSVRVSCQNIATYSDHYGWYELNIPPELQNKFINLTFIKKGYEMERIDSIAPYTGQEIGILLKRKRVYKEPERPLKKRTSNTVDTTELIEKYKIKLESIEQAYENGELDISRYLKLKSTLVYNINDLERNANK